jgi:hypothetical protein
MPADAFFNLNPEYQEVIDDFECAARLVAKEEVDLGKPSHLAVIHLNTKRNRLSILIDRLSALQRMKQA